jgi:hypothetical protein
VGAWVAQELYEHAFDRVLVLDEHAGRVYELQQPSRSPGPSTTLPSTQAESDHGVEQAFVGDADGRETRAS